MPVEVAGLDRPSPVSFRREVIAAFNVTGCNAGACHGTPSGKNGFKLSLRGFDPAADFAQLTRDQSGRRVSSLDPAASLILQKGQGQVPHEGGQRLVPDGPPLPADPRVDRRRGPGRPGRPAGALGDRGLARPAGRPGPGRAGSSSPSTARFADGSTRDVTRLTVFSSSDEHVARVDGDGLVEFVQPGEVAILAATSSELVPVRLTYVDPDSAQPWTDPPANNYVDEHLFRKMKQLGLAPAGLAADHEFLRRASLDLCGHPARPPRRSAPSWPTPRPTSGPG